MSTILKVDANPLKRWNPVGIYRHQAKSGQDKMKLLTFNGALVSHGGAREGTGPKPKFTDDKGNPLPTKRVTIPEILNDQDLLDLARKKLKEKRESHQKSG